MITQAWQHIKKGNFAPVYLLVGEESYFVDETIKRLKAALEHSGRSGSDNV